MANRRDGAGLGRTQRIVLNSLSFTGNQEIRDIAYGWPGITASGARSAIMRLWSRGLVEPSGFSPYHDARVWSITERGLAVANHIAGVEADDDA